LLDTVERVVDTVAADTVMLVEDTVDTSVADMPAPVEARIPEPLCPLLHCCRLGILNLLPDSDRYQLRRLTNRRERLRRVCPYYLLLVQSIFDNKDSTPTFDHLFQMWKH
jgi:hypothetical protein